mmetsp:Transcript_19047/g.33896  ORF Transcript_19047/g.33896 Transcript_19047/m.33896 type:complete len:240 (-) Transcript_19047:17-736(-)
MASPTLIDWTKVTPQTDLEFGEPKGGNGMVNVSLEMKNPATGAYAPILVQAPAMDLPFGIKPQRHQNDGPVVKYECAMGLSNVLLDPESWEFTGEEKMKAFAEFLNNIDEAILDNSELNSMAWFKKKMSRDALSVVYNRTIRPSSRPTEYGPILKTVLAQDGAGKFKTGFFNADGTPIADPETIPAHSKVVPILRAYSTWFVGKGFGISWKVAQLMVVERATPKGGVDFTAQPLFNFTT